MGNQATHEDKPVTLSLKSTTRQTQTQTIETVSREEDAQNTEANIEAFLPQYISTLSYIERLHRLLLDVIKDEFERLRIANVTSVQALLLFNIGEKEVNASELRSRGYYQGTNVSYNLKKLVDSGYIRSEQCTNDRRSVRLSLTNEGRNIRPSCPLRWPLCSR